MGALVGTGVATGAAGSLALSAYDNGVGGGGKGDIWNSFKSYRGKIKTNGLGGKKRRYYEWDYTHGDIEVYNHRGEHIGSMDPSTGQLYKPAVPGRRINI